MAGDGVPAMALVAVAGGGLLVWSGLTGASLSGGLRDLISGKAPSGPNVHPISGTAPGTPGNSDAGIVSSGPLAPAGGGTDAANRNLAQLMAAGYGWTGAEWQALDYGWGTLESGFNNQVYNGGQIGGPYQPNTAYGIPQALGHGGPKNPGAPYPAGSAANPPGAGGNSSAVAQIAWGLAYIHGRYGKPSQVPGWTGGPYSGY